MVKVRMEMDEGWVWWPVFENEMMAGAELEEYLKEIEDPKLREFVMKKVTPVFELPDALVSKYRQVYAQWRELQDIFEQLYRIQEGMKPHKEPDPTRLLQLKIVQDQESGV